MLLSAFDASLGVVFLPCHGVGSGVKLYAGPNSHGGNRQESIQEPVSVPRYIQVPQDVAQAFISLPGLLHGSPVACGDALLLCSFIASVNNHPAISRSE